MDDEPIGPPESDQPKLLEYQSSVPVRQRARIVYVFSAVVSWMAASLLGFVAVLTNIVRPARGGPSAGADVFIVVITGLCLWAAIHFTRRAAKGPLR